MKEQNKDYFNNSTPKMRITKDQDKLRKIIETYNNSNTFSKCFRFSYDHFEMTYQFSLTTMTIHF